MYFQRMIVWIRHKPPSSISEPYWCKLWPPRSFFYRSIPIEPMNAHLSRQSLLLCIDLPWLMLKKWLGFIWSSPGMGQTVPFVLHIKHGEKGTIKRFHYTGSSAIFVYFAAPWPPTLLQKEFAFVEFLVGNNVLSKEVANGLIVVRRRISEISIPYYLTSVNVKS